MIPIVLAVFVAILIVSAQALWKVAVSGKIHSIESFLEILISPLLIAGAVLYLVATIIWILMLSRYPFHLVYPFLGLSFIFALFISHFVLHEDVSNISWIGAVIISLGVMILGFGFK